MFIDPKIRFSIIVIDGKQKFGVYRFDTVRILDSDELDVLRDNQSFIFADRGGNEKVQFGSQVDDLLSARRINSFCGKQYHLGDKRKQCTV